MAASPLPQDIATALRYGPQTQQLVRRSSYLSDALRQIGQEGGQNIRSPGELAAKLLATAILQRGSQNATDATTQAVAADRKSYADSLLGGIRGATATEPSAPGLGAAVAPSQPATPQPAAMPAQAQQQASGLPSAKPAAQAGPVPHDIDAMVRTIYGEARNEPPEGQSAVASVILNRARQTGRTPRDIVLEPNQFEPWGNAKTRAELEALDPNSRDYQQILANIAPALGGQDVTGGADHFYSPTAQSALGRSPPAWDNGKGRDLGRHRFFSLGYGGGRQAPPAPEPLAGGPGADQMQPFQVASNGPLTPQMMPSSPAEPSPQAGGAAPAYPPQAGAGAAASQWPTWKPNQEQVAYVEGLLGNPQTYEQGIAEAQKIRAKMAEPAEAEIVNMNGVPFYVSKTPGQGGQPVMIPVPREAMTQTMSAQQAGLPSAPTGAYVQRDPYGNMKEAPFAPPEGYNAGPNGYAPIQGGPADPNRVQAPPANYQLSPQGMQAIQGSAADPKNPMNVMQGTQQLRGEIKTVVDQAIQLKRNIDAVRTGFAQQNGPGDIAMVNGLQKLIDEGVVREGDVALQLKGQGIQGGIAGLQGYMTSEGFFADPKIRQGLLNTANQLYGSLNDNYKTRVMGYKPIADRTYGDGAFEQYVFTPETAAQLGWTGGGQQAPNPALVDRSGRPEGWSGQLPPAQLEAAKRFNPSGKPGSEQNPYIVKTPDEARKLPPGSSILLPDGRTGKVPAR